MKYLILSFIAIVSLSAFTTTHQNQKSSMTTPTERPRNDEVTQLDDLVRGEMAALKAYDQAITDVKDENQRKQLTQIRKDHEKAVNVLSKYVAGKPDILEDTASSGPWGTFAKTWTKGRGLTGNEGAVKALRQGEEHGINEYEEALRDDSLSKELKNTIKAELLPNQKKHIETLKRFM